MTELAAIDVDGLALLHPAPVDRRQALEVSGERLDVAGAGAQRRQVERQLERHAAAEAAHQIVGRVAGEEAALQIARRRHEELGVGTVAATGHAVAALAMPLVERATVGGRRRVDRGSGSAISRLATARRPR